MKIVIRDSFDKKGKCSASICGVVNSFKAVNELIRSDYERVKEGTYNRYLTFYESYTGAEFTHSKGYVVWSVHDAPLGVLTDIFLHED